LAKDYFSIALKYGRKGKIKTITVSEIKIIWQETKKSPLIRENKKNLENCRKQLLRDLDLAKHLNKQEIIQFAQSRDNYREGMLALVRLHLKANKLPDPFAEDFLYNLVVQGGGKENFLYLAPFIAKCQSLPIDDLKAIAGKDDEIARDILRDFQGSAQFSALCKDFSGRPALKEQISQTQVALNIHFGDESMRVKRFYEPLIYRFKKYVRTRPFDLTMLGILTPSTYFLSNYLMAHGASVVNFSVALASGASINTLASLGIGIVTTFPVMLPYLLFAVITYQANQWYQQLATCRPAVAALH